MLCRDRWPELGKWRRLEGCVEEGVTELKMTHKGKKGVPGRWAACTKAWESGAA